MKVNIEVFFATNPFIDAYVHSDFLGRVIFASLIVLSLFTWIILLHKGWFTYRARKHSAQFYSVFELQKLNPLGLECENTLRQKTPNPFLAIYAVLKKHTVDLLNKNKRFGQTKIQAETAWQPFPDGAAEISTSYLSPSDIDFVDAHLSTVIADQKKRLENNLYILSTIVSLAPFLGLLGTVWGILTTFAELQEQTSGNTNQMVIGGLSLALATTVLGLLDAIPALIGYNYLKNEIGSFETDMQGFSTEILASVELQYRQVDLK